MSKNNSLVESKMDASAIEQFKAICDEIGVKEIQEAFVSAVKSEVQQKCRAP